MQLILLANYSVIERKWSRPTALTSFIVTRFVPGHLFFVCVCMHLARWTGLNLKRVCRFLSPSIPCMGVVSLTALVCKEGRKCGHWNWGFRLLGWKFHSSSICMYIQILYNVIWHKIEMSRSEEYISIERTCTAHNLDKV